MLIESAHPAFGSWRLRTAIAGGLTPIITPDGLEPFDLLHPDSKHHQVGFQARASLHPGEFTETGFGLIAASDELPTIGLAAPPLPGLDHVDLKLLGVFGIYAAGGWSAIATWHHANTQLWSPVTTVNRSCGVGYAEAERRLPHDLIGFLRWEVSADAGNNAPARRRRPALGLDAAPGAHPSGSPEPTLWRATSPISASSGVQRFPEARCVAYYQSS